MSDAPAVAPRKRSLLALAPEVPAPSSPGTLAAARDVLRTLDLEKARAFFGSVGERVLKTTASLCPVCVGYVPALVVERGGKVFARKVCATHGASMALLENDIAYYRLSTRDATGQVFAKELVDDHGAAPGDCCEGGACGTATAQGENATCTLLVEITNACNLACRVCYADSKGDRVMPLEDVREFLLKILDAKGGLDSVQITGGEASLHPDFWAIVAFLHEEPRIKKIYLPTNGLLFAKPENAAKLVPFRSKVLVLLQLDSLDHDANMTLRAADPTKPRFAVVEELARLGIFMQLTVTVAQGVNEKEAGKIVDLGLSHDHVKVVALQPTTTSGRYDIPLDPMDRLTMSDVIKSVVAGADEAKRRGKLDEAAFVPIPCSHPNCGWITLFFRRFGILENLGKHVDLSAKRADLTNKALLSTDELRDVVGTAELSVLEKLKGAIGKRIVRSQDIFTVAVKPFMDKHTYDQDRVATCCHHLMDTQGNVTSFCEYNALLRPGDSWERFPTL